VKIRTKTTFLLIWLAASALASGTTGCLWRYSPIIHGATSELEIRIVDDSGAPVPEAKISVVYYTAPEKVKVKEGKTDEQGCFRASGRTIGEVHVWARKPGFYDSKLQPRFRLNDDETARATRKWAPEPVPVTVVLKRILHPANLVLNGGPCQEMPWPATNTVLGFDLERFDWCPPYGEGEYDDLQLEYDFWRSPTNWFQVYSHLTLTMTNGVDGLYLAPLEKFSELNRCYHANPDADYQRRLEFVYDRRTGEVARDIPMSKDHYMVFRTRTKTNEVGEVVSAHYGLIFEEGDYELEWSIIVGFNPTPNDTNLENTRYPLHPVYPRPTYWEMNELTGSVPLTDSPELPKTP
jgi:hypothetical protein